MNTRFVVITVTAFLVAWTVAAPAQTSASYHNAKPLDNTDDIGPLVRSGDHSGIVAFAEYHPVLLKRALDNYAQCLRCGNSGVVESAIAQLLRLHLDVPGLSAEPCIRELRRLAGDGATPVIRLKARLALLLCDEPDLFDIARLQRQRESEKLFGEIAEQLCSRLIGSTAQD